MIPSTSSRLRRLASGFAVAAAAVMLITSSATARPPDHSGPGASGGPAKHGSLLPPDQARTVTLITGDVVRVQGVRGGRPLVVVRPRPGRGNAIFAEFVTASGQIEVVPEDILPLLGRVLDPALFDVTTLIAHGDDDTRRSCLPLVVQGQAGRSAAAAVTAAGLTLRPPNRQSGAGPVAAREPRTGAARMGRVLAAMAAAVLRAGRVTSSATRGIGHIWLAQTAQGRYGTETAAAARATAAPSVRLTLKAIPIPGTAKGQMGAFAYVVNIGNPNLFDREVPINPAGGTAVRVPAGRYWVSGVISDDTNPNERRVAWAGRPELTVSKNTTVKLDGAAAVPVTASVPGHRTVMTTVGFHIERRFASKVFGGLAGGDVFAIGTNVAHDVFAQPTGTVRTGQFHVYTDFELASPAGTARPYVYDLYHLVGARVPRSLAYTATPAEQATFARFDQRFYAVDGSTAPVQFIRIGVTTADVGTPFVSVEDGSIVPGGSTLTEYLSTGSGIRWDEEAAPSLTGQDLAHLWAMERPGLIRYAPGSQHTEAWARPPFRPGPYSGTTPALGCVPNPTVRSRAEIHVEMIDLQDRPDGYDCLALGFPNPWLQATSRTMRLYREGKLISSQHASSADFAVPVAPAAYKLVYTDNTSRALPVSTRTQTTWTFRSAAPTGNNAVRIPLLLVDYTLPLGLDSHPDGSTARFAVARRQRRRADHHDGLPRLTCIQPVADNAAHITQIWHEPSQPALGTDAYRSSRACAPNDHCPLTASGHEREF